MTIEEFDKKADLVETIRSITHMLSYIDCYDLNTDIGITFYDPKRHTSHHEMFIRGDKVLVEKFKQLLLERKQELINEFEKE